MTLTDIFAGTAKSHPLIQGAVIPDFSGFTDDDPTAVIDEQSLADLSTRVDLNTGFMSGMLGNPACDKKALSLIKPMRDAIPDDGVQSGI